MPHPFRGNTPPNTFQTVIVGGRSANVVRRAVERFEKRGQKRNRDYAIINPFFRRGGRWGHTNADAEMSKIIKRIFAEVCVILFSNIRYNKYKSC